MVQSKSPFLFDFSVRSLCSRSWVDMTQLNAKKMQKKNTNLSLPLIDSPPPPFKLQSTLNTLQHVLYQILIIHAKELSQLRRAASPLLELLHFRVGTRNRAETVLRRDGDQRRARREGTSALRLDRRRRRKPASGPVPCECEFLERGRRGNIIQVLMKLC